MIKITAEYGRVIHVSQDQFSEWLDDILEATDERMSLPLSIGDRVAFCAPELIRAAVTTEAIRAKVIDKSL